MIRPYSGKAPARRAALEEGVQAFLPLLARATLGDAAGGLQAVERRVEDEPLRVPGRLRSGGEVAKV
jgi:hypothetical protein